MFSNQRKQVYDTSQNLALAFKRFIEIILGVNIYAWLLS